MPLAARAQTAVQAVAAAKADYAQEAYVIEQFSRKETFENDGTFLREDAARVRIQTEVGVQKYGLLAFSYPSATGTFEMVYVRVRKPDGSVVETPAESVQDMAAQITREAPFYSDLHEKHVAVKGLSIGDVLEFKTEERTTKPLAPGQFWTSYRFARDPIVLDELLEISVPLTRAVKMKSADMPPASREAGGYRVYTWHHSNLQRKDQTHPKREATALLWQQLRGRSPQADVLMSSFASWEEVGRWYGGLQDERVKPTPEIAAKAADLTKNALNDDAKLHALYSFVSTQFRYIGVSFGIGRYQPHSAAEVLANQYGDCKDKHTLLASLLTAVGIPAYPALISTSTEVDGDVPSPGQFDHVITVVPREGGLVWLDTTAEVGPYQYLVAPLRDKHALAIWKEKPAALSSTPADLPYQTMQKFDMDAQLDDSGTLEGRVEFSARGDNEFLMRSGFRAVALPQWRELGQRISFSLGFGGEVSEVTASSPEKTDEPFHFAYKYTRKEYGDWANRRTVTPSPLINLLAPGDEELLPLGPSWLGELLDVQCHSRMQLPSGYRPELPPGAHLKWNFAEYDSTYEFKDGALISDRHLKTLLHEVPASQREDYKQFMKTMLDDYGYFISLSSRADTARAANNDNLNISLPKDLADLPISLSPEAMRLEGEAHDAMANHDGQGAVSSLYRAVAADPKFTRAWVILGALLLIQKQVDAGIDAYHKAMAADPTRAEIPKALGGSLMWSSHYQQAVPVWQEYLKAHPDDINVSTSLGFCLFQLKRYSEAADAYAAALKIDGTRAVLIERLGTSYLLAGARDKAEAAFAKLAGVSQDGSAFNDAAYEMANADLNLPQAREYAKKAVRAIEEQSQKITLPDLKEADLRQIQNLSAYWDTLGWINERMSDLDSAELYLRAAWKLTQDPVVATHLCQVYEKVHKIEAAVPMCHMALERAPMPERQAVAQYKAEIDAEQERLDRRASATKLKNTGGSSDVLTRERTFKLERFLPGTESAEFFLLLASDGKSKTFKVEDVKFVSGSAKMKLEGKQLKSIDFNFPSPSDFPTRFVRRGILGCYQYTGCSFVLFEPASVRSVE